jgi:predicted N-acetyltransferase YhbS
MSAERMIVRDLAREDELEAYLDLAVDAFHARDGAERIAGWRQAMRERPRLYPTRLRGAFEGPVCVGGYSLFERPMRLGHAGRASTWLRVGCLGAVAVHSERRNHGIGRALLQDVLAQSVAQGQHLLLLHGIPDYYQRFGLVNVFDTTYQMIARQALQALPRSAYPVRAATPLEAPALLDLYQRHYGERPGGFARDLARQERLMGNPPPWVALDALGQVCGYLVMPSSPGALHPAEVAANDWQAALALLQWHNALLTAQFDPPEGLRWPLPERCLSACLLGEHLALRSEVRREPNAGWMARPIHFEGLLDALLPLWQARWRRHGPAEGGGCILRIEGASRVLRWGPEGLHASEAAPDAPLVSLGAGAFVQLLLGYRPLEWALQSAASRVTDELLPALETLFPFEPIWIAGTDAF